MYFSTTSVDDAGNVDEDTHGWLCYYPDADNPWIEFDQGTSPSTNDSEPSDVTKVYPSRSLQGYASDDDGVTKIEFKLYRKNSGVWSSEPTVTTTNFANPSTFTSWEFIAPSAIATYKLETTVYDINNKPSEPVVKYFMVNTDSPPVINVTSHNSGDIEFEEGGKTGSFTLQGSVNDDGPISSLKLVRIPSGASELSSYLEVGNDIWASFTPGYDSSNNVMKWNVSLGEENFSNSRYVRNFSQEINLFNNVYGYNGLGLRLVGDYEIGRAHV